MSIANAIVCDRAVFKHIETYHGLEIALRGASNHAHEAASLLDLFLCITLKVLVDSVDVKLMLRGQGSWRRIIINICVIDVLDQQCGGLWVWDGIPRPHEY
jgi:hypothetical protein